MCSILWVSIGSHTAGVCVTGRSVAKSSSAFRVRSTLQESASQVAVWRKSHPLFVTLLEYALWVAVWRKAHPPFVPGPMILGAQAPGKVESTLQEYALRDAVWRKARPPFVSPGKQAKMTISNEVVFLCSILWVSIGSHTAGACVTGRSVAKSSSAFRVRSTLQEYAFWVAVWRKARPLFVYEHGIAPHNVFVLNATDSMFDLEPQPFTMDEDLVPVGLAEYLKNADRNQFICNLTLSRPKRLI